MSGHSLTRMDQVWNLACDSFSEAPLEAGDRALRDMLRAYGMICNGGVFHVFDTLTEAQIEAAKAGYCFFGLDPVARLISRANLLLTGMAEELGDMEAALYAEYASYIPDDSELTSRFERHYAAKPADFAPLV